MKETFKRWMDLVAQAVSSEAPGLFYEDLGDKDWYGWYSSGVSPKNAAQMALQDEGFYRFVYGS